MSSAVAVADASPESVVTMVASSWFGEFDVKSVDEVDIVVEGRGSGQQWREVSVDEPPGPEPTRALNVSDRAEA